MDKEITTKDYFAAKAMQAAMSNPEMWRAMCMDSANGKRDSRDTVEDYVAQESYRMAEAMMRERRFVKHRV